MRYLFLFILSNLFLLVAPLSGGHHSPIFSSQLSKASPGDFVVTHQSGNYSLLVVRSLEKGRLILEEITVPERKVRLNKINWSDWVHNQAPGHTSWIMFEIDLANASLLEGYHLTKRGWLYLQEDDHLLVKLLQLSAERLSSEERKRIGPAPRFGEPDFRPLWSPSIVFEGTKRKDPTEAWRAQWPNDKSQLSGSRIDAYFNTALPDFPFPFWLEIYGGHYTEKIRVVQAGKNLHSPAPALPRRPIVFLQAIENNQEQLTMRLGCPRYYTDLKVFAINTAGPLQAGIPVPFSLKREGEEVSLTLDKKGLSHRLTSQHRYRFAITADGLAESYAESQDTFLVESN